MTAIGKRIRQERRAREWSQRFLGKLLGVSYQTIWNYEKGNTQPNKENLRTLEAVFQIDLRGGNDEEADTRK